MTPRRERTQHGRISQSIEKSETCRIRRFSGILWFCSSLIVCTPVLSVFGAPAPRPVKIETVPIPFSSFEPSRTKFGALSWQGGFEIESEDKRFGGLSGIAISRSGRRIVAVSDKGRWLTGSLSYRDDRLVDLKGVRMAPLLDTKGRPLKKRRHRDAESISLFDADLDGRLLVAFERNTRAYIYRFGRQGLKARARRIPLPSRIRRGPLNNELEAIGRFPKASPFKGGIIAVSEHYLDRNGNIRAWMVGGAMPGAFAIRPVRDYHITDLAIVPGTNDILTLERRFTFLTGPGMLIRWHSAADLRPGAVLSGKTLIEADLRFNIDNMEGLAIHRGPRGDFRLTIVSDDNFNAIQRTLMLQFSWDGKSHVKN